VQHGETIGQILSRWQALSIKTFGLRFGPVLFKKSHASVCHFTTESASPTNNSSFTFAY
jgi:hypothetical protein